MALEMMCGAHGAKHCTGPKWMNFMGLSFSNGGYAPFQINYQFAEPNDPIYHNTSYAAVGPLSLEPVGSDQVPPGMDATDPKNQCPCLECSTCMETRGQRLLESVVSKLSSYKRAMAAMTVSIYSLSSCMTSAIVLYILIICAVLVYFLVFNNHEKSSYDGMCSKTSKKMTPNNFFMFFHSFGV